MFYWLIDLSNTVPGLGVFLTVFNVFLYITFRTGGAVAPGAAFVFLFGPGSIDHLRLSEGPGTPAARGRGARARGRGGRHRRRRVHGA